MQTFKLYTLVLIFFGLAPAAPRAQDSLHMTTTGRWEDPALPTHSGIRYNDIWGYVDCAGREYAIAGSAGQVHFIQLPVGEPPVEVHRHPGSSNSVWRDFKTFRDRAYAVADQGSDGLLIFDLSQLPDTVILTNQLTDRFTRAHNIFIDESNGLLYAVGVNAAANAVVFDLNDDPDEPVVRFNGQLPGGYIHDIYVRDNIAFASSGFNGLWVYDFSDPETPTVLGSLTAYPESGYNHASWLNPAGDKLIFADETHGRSLKLTDVSDYTDMEVISLFKSALLAPENTGSIAHNPFIRGQYAIVSYYHDGVQIFDLSDPENVTQAAYYDTYPDNQGYGGYDGNWGVYPFLPSERIIATDITYGLFVLTADSIDFDDIEPPIPPELSFASPADTTLCQGDMLNIALTESPENTTWWYEGTPLVTDTNVLAISEPGQYWVTAQNGPCFGFSDTLNIALTPLPDVGYQVSAQEFCTGDTVWINASGTADLYQWTLNGEVISTENDGSLAVTTGGIYRFEASLGDCSAASEPVLIEEQEIPEVALSATGEQLLCQGDTLLLSVSGTAEQYGLYVDLVNLGLITGSVPLTQPGNYYVIAESGQCQAISDSLQLAVVAPAMPTISADGNTLATGAALAYQWYLDGAPIPGAEGPVWTAEVSGEYQVSTVDANGCSALSEPVTVIVSSLHDQASAPLHLYPNPASEKVYLSDRIPAGRIELYDINGRMVLQQQLIPVHNAAIDISELPAGVYSVRLITDEKGAVVKLVKE